jgi:hypothetical protein
VTALQDRDCAGKFTVGTYRLSVPADALDLLPATAPIASPSTFEPAGRRPARPTASHAIQLALLDPI